MRLYSFGAILLPQLNGSNQLPVSFRSGAIALRNGGFDRDGSSSYLESKQVTSTFWVAPNDTDGITDVDAFLDSLYAEASLGRRILVATMRDGTLRQCEAKMTQGTSQVRAKIYVPDALSTLDGYEPVNVNFEIIYPYWKAVEDSVLFWDSGWFWDSDINWDSGTSETGTISTTTSDFTVNNIGAVQHEDTKLVITGGAGVTVTDVRVDNLTSGEYIEWTGTITATEVLTIQTLPQTIDLDGVGEWDNTTIPSTQLGFWTLLLGENDFRITVTSVTGGTADYEFFWQKQYIR